MNNMIMLLKNMKLLDQTLMEWIIYSVILLKIAGINIFIHLNIDVYMIITL